jgi:negative regulator of replication initiation
MMNSIAILPATPAYWRERIRHFTAHVEIFRRFPACRTGSKAAPAPAPTPVVEVKPANPLKDKVRAMRELLLSDEYAEQKRAVNRFMLVLTTLYS